MDTVLEKKFEQIENKIFTGKFKEALQDITKIEQNTNSLQRDLVICNILKSQLFYIFQPFSKAITYGEEALKGSLNVNDFFLIFDSAFYYGRALCITGNLDVGVEKLKLAEETLNKIENKESFEFLKRKALILCHYKGWRDGYEVVLDQLTRAFQIVENIGYDFGRVNVLYELASLYQWHGDYKRFKEYLQMCLDLAEKFGYIEYIMWSFVGFGTIDLYQGDLENSLVFFEKARFIANKLESSYALSFILGDIGLIYWHKQDSDSALKYYDDCIRGLEDAQNTKHRQYPWILFRSILVLLEQNRINEVKEKHNIIQSISDMQVYRPQHLSHKISKLSKALLLKKISSEDKFNEIITLLEEIAYDSLIHDEMNKTALYHLCDLYVQQLLETKDMKFLSLIKEKLRI